MNNNTYSEVTGYSGSTQITLESRFLKERKVFLQGPITAETANDLVMKLMYMEKDDSNEPVRLYVNSPGGEVNGGLLIYDMLQSMTKPVEIYCAGMAASMAAIILASGGKGRRHILPHSRVMIHEPLLDGGLGGSATSIRHISESIMETKRILNEILSKHTGRAIAEIEKATSYDNYMNAEESVAFGICDDITEKLI